MKICFKPIRKMIIAVSLASIGISPTVLAKNGWEVEHVIVIGYNFSTTIHPSVLSAIAELNYESSQVGGGSSSTSSSSSSSSSGSTQNDNSCMVSAQVIYNLCESEAWSEKADALGVCMIIDYVKKGGPPTSCEQRASAQYNANMSICNANLTLNQYECNR